jgi:hypothetical protein
MNDISTVSTKSPFYNSNGQLIKPFAKLVIKREMLSGKQCKNGADTDNGKMMISKNFDPKDLSDPILRDKMLNDQMTFKKKTAKEVNIIGKKKIDVYYYNNHDLPKA